MADNTLQGGLDNIATDELLTINGVSAVAVPPVKVQRVKTGYGADSDFNDVSVAKGLPIGSAYLDVPLVANQTTFTTAANGTPIDCTGFNWMGIQMSAGYTGMTSLTVQGSNDGVSWFSLGITSVGSSSSGIGANMGTAAGLINGSIPCRYIRFVPVGTGSGLVLTLNVRLFSQVMVLQSAGVNAALAAISTGIAPAIATAPLTVGTGAANGFQVRVTGSADVTITTLLASVSGQLVYVTGIYWSIWGTGINTPRLFRIVAAANALIEHNILGHPQPGGGALVAGNGWSGERKFRNPWKTMSTTNNILQYAVTSQGAAVGNWELIVEGYYQTT